MRCPFGWNHHSSACLFSAVLGTHALSPFWNDVAEKWPQVMQTILEDCQSANIIKYTEQAFWFWFCLDLQKPRWLSTLGLLRTTILKAMISHFVACLTQQIIASITIRILSERRARISIPSCCNVCQWLMAWLHYHCSMVGVGGYLIAFWLIADCWILLEVQTCERTLCGPLWEASPWCYGHWKGGGTRVHGCHHTFSEGLFDSGFWWKIDTCKLERFTTVAGLCQSEYGWRSASVASRCATESFLHRASAPPLSCGPRAEPSVEHRQSS